MNRLKKLWSLAAICGMMIGIFPLSIFAETTEEASVVINDARMTNSDDQEITEDTRIKPKETIKTKLNWSLAQAALIEEGTMVAVDLPDNLNFPEQSGSLGEMGNYQVMNQQLILQFTKNYQETDDGRAPDFTSVKFYEGLLELNAEPTAEDLETETIDFGNNIHRTLYYAKKTAPENDPLNQVKETKELQPRAHEPNLNARGVDLFNNIKITDLEGNEFSETNPAVKDANINIHFDWILDNQELIKDGDYYTYQLPDYFSVHNIVTDILKNDDGDVLGSFTLGLDGLLTVTFNDKPENLSERQGTIDLKTELKLETDTEIVEIPTNITDDADDEITITIPVVKADLNKKGIIEADNTVTWTITLNEDRRDLRNVIVRDHLPEGLTVWFHQYYVMNDNDEWELAPVGFINAWQDKDDYVYKFGSGIMNQPVKIILKMKVADKEKKEFLNKATITGDNFISNSSEASVSFIDKDNYKYCTDYDLNTGKFNWEVKATYTNADGKLKDWMYSRYGDPNTANHYLIKNSIKVYKYDQDGKAVLTDKWSFSEDSADFKKKDGEYVHFTLKFEEKGVYKVTYSTQSFEVPTPINTDLMNMALVIDGSKEDEISGGEKPTVDGTLGVEKKALDKDFSNNTIGWQVVFNKNRISMKNAVITDKFATLAGTNKSALQLIESTLKVTANDGTTDKPLNRNSDYVLEKIDGDSDYSTGFIIKLIGSYSTTDNQITIDYSTHYFVDKQQQFETGAILRFDNSAIITYEGEDGRTHTDGAEVATWVDIKFAYNGVKYGKYLEQGGEVTSAFSHANPFSETTAGENSVYWTALFNTWKTTVPKDTTIKEALGEGQTLKELVIYDVNIEKNKVEVASLGRKWEKDVDYKYELVDGVPVITLSKDTKSTFAIFVSAEASDEIPKYKNVATMTVKDTKPLVVEGMVEKSDKDSWITKKGTQATGDDYRLINWSVVLNKDSHKIINPTVTDTVSINEQSFVYDADKNVVVKVYKAKDNGSGTFVKDGPAIEFAEGKKPTVTSDSIEGTQTLTIDLGDSIDTPYIIDYQTLLDPGIQNNEIVKNSASLFGKDIQFHETTTSVTIKSTDGEGTSSGKNGSLKFKKVDESNQLITASSAFFDLYRKDSQGNLTLMFSDIEVKGDKIIEGGVEVDHLSNLRYGTYVIVESKAPDGYVKDETKHEIIISKDQVNHTFTLENKSATNQLETKISLEAKKKLTGRTLQADEFSFKLTGEGVDQTKKNAADGKVLFDEISYTKEGVHEYTISEVIPSEKAPGMTYDETKYKVTVTVEEKAGKLEASAVYENVQAGEVPVFENAYKALPTSIKLEAQKELSGRTLKENEFSFKLKGDNVDETVKNNGQGKVEFTEINYDKAGTYEYTISEVLPSDKEIGMTYDETKYKVTVTVEEKSGKLEAAAVYENVQAGEVPVFKNIYKALPTSIKLEAQKELSGRTLKENEFSFNLKGDNVDETVKNNGQGKVEFTEIKYDKADTYEYTISEVLPTDKENGMTYDETQYKVTVTVEEKSGKLEAAAVYENVQTGEVPVFKNTYKASPTSIKLEAQKELSGRTLKENEFSFKLKGDNVDETVKNNGQGKVEFTEINYDKAGTYEYTISEVIPSEKEMGITYDDTQYKVVVTVEEKDGKLEATAVYENVKTGDIPIFKNSYTPEKKVPTGEILLKKIDSKTGKTLAGAEFKLVDPKGKTVAGKEKIVTGEDGSIIIKDLTDGNYQLIETKAPKGYQIDETPIDFSVKNSQPSKKEISQKNDPIGLPETGDSTSTNVQTTYRNNTTVSKRLPSTGSVHSKGLVILGLFFLGMVGLVAFGKRKKV
ncbi:Spy0128 family protein [Candidatus Enterococcus murrayae]|uniref:LPXTG cell wall anchor domain-containing protein n=1 Tax=Candidatus Enterococcus murrayae TaxID=2815321 RepID=A0ABS3HIS6_9ENTE|nr:FctA domain-containing protein [Enterococcus sp. MJM16]MBO0453366.1 LPXTG cell wall anchor domain-containing protein [Enterococcus sp. MJM16]